MTARDDAIEAAFEAMLRVDGRVSDRALAAVVEAAEPIIRADERQHLRTSVANMWGRSSEWDDAIEAVLRQMDASLGGESE